MTVDVHETGDDHHPAGVDLRIDRAGIAFPDMDDVRASNHEVRVTEVDMGSGSLVPGDNPIAVPEEGRLGDNASHFRLHEGIEGLGRKVRAPSGRESLREADMTDRHGDGGLRRLDDRDPDGLLQGSAITSHAGTSHHEDVSAMSSL